MTIAIIKKGDETWAEYKVNDDKTVQCGPLSEDQLRLLLFLYHQLEEGKTVNA